MTLLKPTASDFDGLEPLFFQFAREGRNDVTEGVVEQEKGVSGEKSRGSQGELGAYKFIEAQDSATLGRCEGVVENVVPAFPHVPQNLHYLAEPGDGPSARGASRVE